MNKLKQQANIIWEVSADMNISYSMIEQKDIFDSNDPNLFGTTINQHLEPIRRLIVIDENVFRLYGEKIQEYFKKNKIKTKILSLMISEEHKTTETLFKILEEFDNFNLLRRREPVIAIGGGVLLDIVGFAANLYRRGVPYIRIPTTLIGLIDAGIGVKTGLNFNGHKNRIGTYYQPNVSYIDPTFLKTLDKRHISNGLAEILKIALIKDASLFALLEKYGDKLLEEKLQNLTISTPVLHKAIEGMLEELEPNLWEHTLERLVDFGHTFSGVLEMRSLPQLLHGEAVNIDMAIVSVMAYKRNLITQQELLLIVRVMRKLQLPIFNKFCTPDILYGALVDTAYHRDGMQRFPIPNGIGKAIFINDITYGEVKDACLILKDLSKNN